LVLLPSILCAFRAATFVLILNPISLSFLGHPDILRESRSLC
jgi:hypothetical protein